ncbi:YkvA family protein [Ancylobacter terrae]|uniref:YkvA family protein n=1 Tax=Ancylobacter sp. sgz301288 TaxID=3342077 RepID=UPI00385E3199
MSASRLFDDGEPFTETAGDDETRVRDGFWDKLRRTAGRVPFAEDATAAYYCALDRQTPLKVRALLFGALAYFVLPADTLPDVMPVLGFTDDAAVIATALNLLAGHIRPEHRTAAREALGRVTRRRSS